MDIACFLPPPSGGSFLIFLEKLNVLYTLSVWFEGGWFKAWGVTIELPSWSGWLRNGQGPIRGRWDVIPELLWTGERDCLLSGCTERRGHAPQNAERYLATATESTIVVTEGFQAKQNGDVETEWAPVASFRPGTQTRLSSLLTWANNSPHF